VDEMKTKNHQNLFNWIGAICLVIPLLAWLAVFYSNTMVMASNVDDLQNEKNYIRSSLEQIISRLATIEGKIEEHSRQSIQFKRTPK
jgi:uncharacterized membrane protein YukC